MGGGTRTDKDGWTPVVVGMFAHGGLIELGGGAKLEEECLGGGCSWGSMGTSNGGRWNGRGGGGGEAQIFGHFQLDQFGHRRKVERIGFIP